MVIVGAHHPVQTDGFAYIRSDWENLKFDSEEQLVYEKAIANQDLEFPRACQGERCSVTREETLNLAEPLDHFRSIGESNTA
jgi:hypothetical protein